ncbi:MAG: hypothetical protein C4523_04850 [Myxococcales bacterium]|nr:MAG: hypothetical protein C4523_04850 [Myxococcales bacterium]
MRKVKNYGKITPWLFAGFCLLTPPFLVAACDGPGEDKPRTIVISPAPEDGDTDVEDADTPPHEKAEFSLCAVTIRLVFEAGEGREIQFDNGDDAAAVVEIRQRASGGLLVQTCLNPDGEDRREASFAFDDELAVRVFLGEGELASFACEQSLDDLLGVFPLCDEANVRVETR